MGGLGRAGRGQAMRSWGDIISGGQASSGSRGLSLLKCNVGMTPPPPSLGCHEAQKPRGSPGCGASELSPGPAVTEAGVHEVGGPCTGGGEGGGSTGRGWALRAGACGRRFSERSRMTGAAARRPRCRLLSCDLLATSVPRATARAWHMAVLSTRCPGRRRRVPGDGSWGGGRL